MAEKELIPNDTPEIAKLKACKTKAELIIVRKEIVYRNGYEHFSDTYRLELATLFVNLLNELPS